MFRRIARGYAGDLTPALVLDTLATVRPIPPLVVPKFAHSRSCAMYVCLTPVRSPVRYLYIFTAQSDATLVDIRPAFQVETKGSPGLSRGSQNKLINVEFDEIAVRMPSLACPARPTLLLWYAQGDNVCAR